MPEPVRQKQIAAAVSRVMDAFVVGSEAVADWLQCAVRRLGDDVDVNVAVLAGCLFRRGMWCMEQNDFTTAFELFEAADRIEPSAIAVYNAACCQAQLGQLECAVGTLRRAVASGYSNAQHMMSDPDLVPLHGLPAFHDVMTGLNGASQPQQQQQQPECAQATAVEVSQPPIASQRDEHDSEQGAAALAAAEATTTPPPSTATPAAPAAGNADGQVCDTANAETAAADVAAQLGGVPREHLDAFHKLCAMGFCDARRNIAALRASRGQMAAAVDALLDGRA